MADNVTLNPGSGGDTLAANDIGGVKYQRVKVTWGAAGAVNDASAAAPLPTVQTGALPAGTNTIGYIKLTDGTNFAPTFDTAGRRGYMQITDGTNSLPTMDAAARRGYVQVSDGTNSPAIKAASTAAAAADPSMVVNISPNSPAHPVTQSGTWTMQPGNTANTTPWLMSAVPTTAGGQSTSYLVAGASNNATVAKASAGQVYGVVVGNVAGAVRYVKLYDKATTPAPASDTPKMVVPVPAGGVVTLTFDSGVAFGTGIAYATVTGIAGNDNTSVAANDLVVTVFYK